MVGYGHLKTAFIPGAGYRRSIEGTVERTRARFELAGRDRLTEGLDAFVAEGGIEDLLARQERRADLRLLSGLGKLRARYRRSGFGELDAFFLAQSGDGSLPADLSGEISYGAFMSLAPLFDVTSLFFNGSLATSVASPAVATLAPDNAGLIAGGLGARVFWSDGYSTHLRGAIMSATVENTATGSPLYGGEINVLTDALIADNVLIYADVALFFPGDYFPNASVAWQVVAAMQLFLQ